jgi:hypothetical protein
MTAGWFLCAILLQCVQPCATPSSVAMHYPRSAPRPGARSRAVSTWMKSARRHLDLCREIFPNRSARHRRYDGAAMRRNAILGCSHAASARTC